MDAAHLIDEKTDGAPAKRDSAGGAPEEESGAHTSGATCRARAKKCRGCRKVKCACCMAMALPVVLVLSPLLIARRLIFGPLKCKRRGCCKRAAAGEPPAEDRAQTVAGQGAEQAEVKVDQL